MDIQDTTDANEVRDPLGVEATLHDEMEPFCHPEDVELQARHGHPSEWSDDEVNYLLGGIYWLYENDADLRFDGDATALAGLQIAIDAEEGLRSGVTSELVVMILNSIN